MNIFDKIIEWLIGYIYFLFISKNTQFLKDCSCNSFFDHLSLQVAVDLCMTYRLSHQNLKGKEQFYSID